MGQLRQRVQRRGRRDKAAQRRREHHVHDGGMDKTGAMEGIRTLAGYADTKSHGRVRFVIALAGDGGETRFRLLRAIESEL
jgi:D-alanyl-D-alanine carboxypeptidase